MKPRKNVCIKTDATTRFCLVAITVLLAVLVIGLWVDRVPSVEPVEAQIRRQPDGPFVKSSSQTQLVEMVNLQKKSNAKLDRIADLLTGGQIKVQVIQDDKSKGENNENVLPRTKK